MLTREGFQIVGSSGVGFGPFSIFGRKIMSSERAVQLSERLERCVAAVRPFNWLSAHLITTIVRSENQPSR